MRSLLALSLPTVMLGLAAWVWALAASLRSCHMHPNSKVSALSCSDKMPSLSQLCLLLKPRGSRPSSTLVGVSSLCTGRPPIPSSGLLQAGGQACLCSLR